jgi:hypothetical protein
LRKGIGVLREEERKIGLRCVKSWWGLEKVEVVIGYDYRRISNIIAREEKSWTNHTRYKAIKHTPQKIQKKRYSNTHALEPS